MHRNDFRKWEIHWKRRVHIPSAPWMPWGRHMALLHIPRHCWGNDQWPLKPDDLAMVIQFPLSSSIPTICRMQMWHSVNSLSGWWFQPLWKIVSSVGMIIPNIWKNKKCSKPPTSYSRVCRRFSKWCHQSLGVHLDKSWLCSAEMAEILTGPSITGLILHDTYMTEKKDHIIHIGPALFSEGDHFKVPSLSYLLDSDGLHMAPWSRMRQNTLDRHTRLRHLDTWYGLLGLS